MFTGIIQDLGKVINRGPGRLVISSDKLTSACGIGDSMAVNGVCLTIVEISSPFLTMDLLEETDQRTNLVGLKPGDMVNLEPALQVSDRIGGHFVTGHIDGAGKLLSRRKSGRDWIFKVSLPSGLEKYVVEKGSITLEGVSLTVVEIRGRDVSVHIIPHTFSHTNLGEKPEGSLLNVETDLLGKYVVRYLEKNGGGTHSIDMALLEETGFL